MQEVMLKITIRGEGLQKSMRMSLQLENNRRIYSLLFPIILLIGALLRLYLLLNGAAMPIDSDEAIVGLMGKRILEWREYPVFYYGQDYMGSLEAFMIAGVFAIFGVSVLNLKLLMLTLSMGFIALTYYLAKFMTNKGAALLSILFLSIPPPFLSIWGLKARGGYIETLIFGSSIIFLAFKIMEAGKNSGHAKRYDLFALIGFVGGAAWWTNMLIIYYFIPVIIFLYPVLKKGFLLQRVSITFFSFVLGSLPAWIYKIMHIGESPHREFIQVSFDKFLPFMKDFFLNGMPIIFGARLSGSKTDIFPLASDLILGVYEFAIIYYIVKRGQYQEAQRRMLDFALLFLFSMPVIFSLSETAGGFVLEPRYLMPIYSVITIFLAAVISEIYKKARYFAIALIAIVFSIHSYGTAKMIISEPSLPFASWVRAGNDYKSLIKLFKDKGVDAVYADYWIAPRLTFEADAEILAIPWGTNSNWDRYPKYHEMAEDRKKTAFILQGISAGQFEKFLLGSRIPFEKVKDGNYEVFFNLKAARSISKTTDVTSSKKWSCSASANASICGNAFDGDPLTRWNTGTPQKPGMFYQLNIRKGRHIRSLAVNFGPLFDLVVNDYPRSLSIQASQDGLKWTELKPDVWLEINDRNNAVIICDLQGFNAQHIKLIQNGYDPINWWGIHEIFVDF